MEEQVNETKEIGVKQLSKWVMFFASAWVALGTGLKAVKVIDIDMTDIIYSAVAIVGIWSPTYLSVWLDKIRDIKFGKSA